MEKCAAEMKSVNAVFVIRVRTIQHTNKVAFLCFMKYYRGILFLITNQVGDIDDAIHESRPPCCPIGVIEACT